MPFHRGPYSPHPRDYKPKGTRPYVQCSIRRPDRNLLWYLGANSDYEEGSVSSGIYLLCRFFREHPEVITLWREFRKNPEFEIPKEAEVIHG